jgi:NADH-quinone oxidoreductase subunit J
VAALVAGLGLGVLLIAGIGNVSVAGFRGLPESSGQSASSLAEANSSGNVEGLAALLFTRYLWAFELTGALLITAALGAMVLAHRERFDRRKTQRELAVERFTGGGHPTPMPNPGVYARHNAVDVPARLPDGRASELSVSGILQAREVPVRSDAPQNGSHNASHNGFHNGSHNGSPNGRNGHR